MGKVLLAKGHNISITINKIYQPKDCVNVYINQHDPDYYFHGEEISLAARAYTHGYDLFHPHKIICYHEYTRKGRPHHWDDCNKEQGREHDWWEINEMCHKRNRILFGMDGEDPNQINFGEYGFGTERTLEDYQRYSGIHFGKRAIQKWVYWIGINISNGGLPG